MTLVSRIKVKADEFKLFPYLILGTVLRKSYCKKL